MVKSAKNSHIYGKFLKAQTRKAIHTSCQDSSEVQRKRADECLSDQSQSAHHQASGWEEMILAGQNWFPCGTWHIARDPTKSASRLLVQWS